VSLVGELVWLAPGSGNPPLELASTVQQGEDVATLAGLGQAVGWVPSQRIHNGGQMRTLTPVAFLLCVVATLPLAQTKPDFSGKWVLDVDRSWRGSEDGSRLPADTLVVRQTATEVTFEQSGEPGTLVALSRICHARQSDRCDSEFSHGRRISLSFNSSLYGMCFFWRRQPRSK
jgi:hypothetical protein